MADNVRYVLDKMAPLFKQLEEMEIFSSVSSCIEVALCFLNFSCAG